MQYPELLSKKTGVIILHPLLIALILLFSYPITHTISTPFWFIILTSFILAIIFLLAQNWLGDVLVLYLVFITDIPLIGAMIHYTGGLDSMFPLLYVLLTILASLYLFRRGAYIVSLGAVVFFFALAMFERTTAGYPAQLALYRFSVFGLLFLFTGILSGSLSERYQRRAEEAASLRLTTEEIIRNLPTGILTVDSTGNIVYTNIAQGPLQAKVHLYMARFLNDPKTENSIEIQYAKRYYVLSCARIEHVNAALGILQDYTNIRKLEEKSRVAEQIKLLATLGGSLAHEIRNPLASIRGSLEVVRDTEEESKAVHFINMALKESIRLNEIVTDFLNFAQFVPLKKNRLHISEVINEALVDTIKRAETKNIQIRRKDGDFSILGDMNKLKSCFENVLNNAFEVSRRGQTVHITSHHNETEGFVEITDHGKGIPRNELKKVFDPFFTTKKGGIGLGLAIARNIIESHGGTIKVRSRAGKGTTFKLILPLA
jgi:two-component system sensor histidine kinase PilS (NtrC family)